MSLSVFGTVYAFSDEMPMRRGGKLAAGLKPGVMRVVERLSIGLPGGGDTCCSLLR